MACTASRVRSRSGELGGLSFTTTTSTSTPCWSSTEWMARGSMSARLNVGIMTDIFMEIPSCAIPAKAGTRPIIEKDGMKEARDVAQHCFALAFLTYDSARPR